MIILLARAEKMFANPSGLSVGLGSATAQQVGSQLNVTVSQLTILNWQSFNIGAGQTTTFLQPSANSIVFNQIGGANPSQILGNLNANGTVILANANGFYFGNGSVVKVGGSFIATTAALPPDFGTAAGWQFTGMPPLASIVNYGQIQVGAGRSLFLIAENIQNQGSLSAPAGNIELAAGQSMLVSETPDGRGLSAAVTLPQGSVDNFGRITADAGTIALNAQVVNQNGVLQADSVQNQNGEIELVASDSLNLGANSQILATGDASTPGSAGGNVVLKSGGTYSDADGSTIATTGGANGGNGGNIEVSAPNIESLDSAMDAGAQSGFTGGNFLLDPANIVLGTSSGYTGTVPAGGTVDANSGSGTLDLNVNTAFKNKNFSQILLEATGNISLDANTTWNLSSTVTTAGGISITTGQLILEAGGNITFGSGSKIIDANDWSVSLFAGVTGFSANAPMVQSGVGNIYLNGGSGLNLNGAIQTAQGSISLEAGDNINTGKGYVVTTGGGSLFAEALAGDLTTGTTQVGGGNTGYTFNNNNDTYSVSKSYGGFGTYGGGDVTLIAGDSIDPITTSPTIYGVSGAFGSAAGNVTLEAGNQVSGVYNVANGTGTILAGVTVNNSTPSIYNSAGSIGASLVPVTLGLIGGSSGAAWNLWAANNINVLEVRNPNGAMQPDAQTVSGIFDYAPNAAVSLWAGNGITLGSPNLALSGNGPDENSTAVYAPTLNLTAGSGGITIYNSIVLSSGSQNSGNGSAPFSLGSLKISDGGDLTMIGDSSPSLLMSDSVLTDYSDFSSSAGTPLHLGDGNPVTVNVAGNIYNFNLFVPTYANVTVGGSTYNFGFTGQNLSPLQTTCINVGGDILYGDGVHAAAVALTEPLPAGVFTSATLLGDLGTGVLSYDAAGGRLSLNGLMNQAALNDLLNPEDPSLALDATQRAAVLALYSETQNANSLALAGSGKFNVNARSIDLGVSSGITADFPNAPDSALTAISPYGADLKVTTSGDLDMAVTTIANGGLLGNINLNIGGKLDVGGEATALGDPNAPKGIFTTSGGNVTINAFSDVNVDGSRIAAYNGGNVNITSQTGDVNAGAGGQGYVIFQSLELNTLGELIALPADVPLSGILATTVPYSDAPLGNITINTPNGSVNSSQGGVLQIAFGNANTVNNFIDVTAGKDINATGSGIIGYNVALKAGGDITGVVVGSQSVNIDSAQNVNVTAVSGGNVDINASGTVSGTIVGGGDVSVSGDSIDASVRGGSVATSGDTTGASLGIPASNVATENAQVADNATTAASKTDDTSDDELNKKKKQIALAQKVSRVTVLLPVKN